jgi:uncharacterized protein (DUF58 family)
MATRSNTRGVYAELGDLIRMQYEARGFSFLSRQPVHSILAGRHASRLRGRGLNFEEIRRYLPGDDVRNMDWKVTARMRRPHVRVYTEERDRPALFVVDQRLAMFFGSQRAMKSVTAAEAAALGAWRVFQAGDRVGAIVFNDEDLVEIGPHRSHSRIMQIFQAIVEHNRVLRSDSAVVAGRTMLTRALQRARRVANHDYLVVLITDGQGADQQTVRAVTELCAHNDMISVFVYDPLEAQLPDAGRVTVSEGARQLEINTSDRALRRRFQDDFEQRMEVMRRISFEREIPLLPITTDAAVAPQLRKLLGHAPSAQRG